MVAGQQLAKGDTLQLIPVIIEYQDTPFEVEHAHRFTAGRMVQDIARVFNRITKRSMRYTTDVLNLASAVPMDPIIKTAGVRNSSDGWWDAWNVIRDHGLHESLDVFCVWHANRLNDQTGIAQPAAPHDFDQYIPFEGAEPEVADPEIGGIATNGFGQLVNALGAEFQGEAYRMMVLYAAHEVGHALGRHHTPHPDTGLSDPVFNARRSIMGYGYADFASGKAKGGEYPNPLLATPDEILTWRRHAIFEDIPERVTSTEPGLADDVIFVRREDQLATLDEIDTPNGRGRLLLGAMTSEFSDPIE